jgi:hypothetical protein
MPPDSREEIAVDQHLLPSRMSLPEVMGDPCASELRGHALALLCATERSDRLIRSHPEVAQALTGLRTSVEQFTASVLGTLAEEAGIPPEGGSISPVRGPMGDYRVDRSSGCWIWMRSLTGRGYPIVGRKANGRENVPGKIYWMLAHGPLAEDQIVVRTCGARLCINPDHARVCERREHGAECMREGSPLDWDAVHEIRRGLSASPAGLHERAGDLAARFGVSRHSILEVFRNKVWFDPDYTPGFEVSCAGPDCDVVFQTTNTVRKYHSRDCCAAAAAARSGRLRGARLSMRSKSPERRAREDAALRAEVAAATAEWSDAVADPPRSSVWSVASLDQPLADDGGTLHDILAARDGAGDPSAELERAFTRELLGDMTEDSVAAMADTELASVRARLLAADLKPSTPRGAREDQRDPPRRG